MPEPEREAARMERQPSPAKDTADGKKRKNASAGFIRVLAGDFAERRFFMSLAVFRKDRISVIIIPHTAHESREEQ